MLSNFLFSSQNQALANPASSGKVFYLLLEQKGGEFVGAEGLLSFRRGFVRAVCGF